MPRLRHQEGHVRELGTKRKYWKGFYYEYVTLPDGTEKAVHKSLTLGWKADKKKWEAEQELRDFIRTNLDQYGRAIAPVARQAPPASGAMTVQEFWTSRYLPVVEDQWAASTKSTNCSIVEAHVLPRFGAMQLSAVTRFEVQIFLKDLATRYSESTYKKARVQLGAIFAEASEQDLVRKSPVARLKTPKLRKPKRSYLAEQEISAVVGQLSGRDRLLVRMFIVLGLRPGEMFALRRNDVLPNGYLRIDEAAWKGLFKEPKTDASIACVWIPESIGQELKWWLDLAPAAPAEALIFPSRKNTPLRPDNVLKRIIKTAAARAFEALSDEQRAAGVLRDHQKRVTHQTLRRSCGTLMKQYGDVKGVQAHLRHASPDMTAGVYIQAIPESVRAAVKALDRSLFNDSITFHHTKTEGYEN